MALSVKELQIGDWVYCYGKPTKVAILTNGKVIATEIGDGVITPIPLTPEILEKNALIKVFENLWAIPFTGKWKKFIGIGNDNFVPNNEGVTIYVTYVHELQHCLRLCRLNELADGFKV